MIEKLTLTKVSITDKKKDGTDCLTKKGKTFWKVGLLTQEHGEEWLNGLVFKEVDWKEGDVVELDTMTEEYQGKSSLKFRIPKAEDKVVAEKDAEIAALKAQLAGQTAEPVIDLPVDEPVDIPKDEPLDIPAQEINSDEINPDDIPL